MNEMVKALLKEMLEKNFYLTPAKPRLPPVSDDRAFIYCITDFFSSAQTFSFHVCYPFFAVKSKYENAFHCHGRPK